MLSARLARRILAQAVPVLKQSRSFVQSTSRFAPFPSIIAVQKPFQVNRVSIRAFSVEVEPLESLGDSISTAVVLSWSKNPGDAVQESDVIAVVETDKVTMDIRAKRGGVFVEALVPAKAEATVGQAFYKLDTAGKAVAAEAKPATPAVAAAVAPAEPTPAAPAATAPKEEFVVNVPIMGESITQGTVGKWFSKVGEFVKADQVVAQLDTDKVNVEVRSPIDGVIVKVFADEGAEVAVANPFFTVLPAEGAAQPAAPAKAEAPKKAETKAAAPAPAPAKEEKKAAKPAAAPAAVAPAVPAGERTETRAKMTKMRQRIAARLKESQNTAAMLTTFQECDMTNLMELRNRFKDDFEKVHGVKLGFMSAFVKAATAALQEIPAVNAVIDDETQEIVFRNYCDVSVAVASPTGLVVPVLRNTEKMSFADVEKTIAMYGQKAKDGKLAIEDMAGGTFTISNGGVFGSLFGTPIINPPQSAILGMHATKMRPVVVDGKVEARPMMYLALTYDHRLIDGREAVTFLKSVAQKIENPSKLLLSL